MAVLVGGAIGSAIPVLLVCFLIHKFGPAKPLVNFIIQLVIGILLTMYLSSEMYGVQLREIDILSKWLGLFIAILVMAIYMIQKNNISKHN